jgi:polar amino acid transport system permease protein
MTTEATTTTRPAPPEQIRAVPVRHPGRWIATAVIAVLVAMFVNMLVTNRVFEWRFMIDNMFTPPVLQGVRTTLIMTVLAMVIGVLIGIVLAILRLSPNPILSGAAWVYIWLFRAIPRYVLLFFVGNLGALYPSYALGLPWGPQLMHALGLNGSLQFLHLDGNRIFAGFTAGLIGLALSEGAYMAEIVRAGIQAVDPGQSEASAALGMSRGATMRRIVLPQAMRVIIPPTGNETISMLKNTSLVSVVAGFDLLVSVQRIYNANYKIIPLLVVASIWYLVMTSILTVGQYYVERHYARGSVRNLPPTPPQKLREFFVRNFFPRHAVPASAPARGGDA